MKAGTRHIITADEYSDFGILDSFVVLKDFSFDKALNRWLAAYGEKSNIRNPGADLNFSSEEGKTEQDFLDWLRSSGYVADEPLSEVHLSDYSRPASAPAEDAGDEP